MNGFDDIENKIKGMKKETSAETDQRILEDTVSEYQRSSKVRQTVFYIGPVFKTIAAIVIIALIAGTAFLVFNKTKKQTPPIVEEIVETKEQIVQPQQKPQPQPIKSEKIQTAEEIKQKENMQKLKDDLTQIAALIQAEDVNTLLAVIENIEEPAQILAATYLAQQDNEKIAEILSELGQKHFPEEPNNLFDIAADKIFSRFTEVIEEANEINEVIVEVALDEPCEVIIEPNLAFYTMSGYIYNEMNEPLPFARVNIAADKINLKTESDIEGWYEITGVPNDISFEIIFFKDSYGYHPVPYGPIDSNTILDIQIFPQAYDWYNRPAPQLVVSEWLNCEPFALSDFIGKHILLYLGLSERGADPYRHLVELNQEYYDNNEITFLAVHEYINDEKAKDKLFEFLETEQIDIPVAIDAHMDEAKGIALEDERYYDGIKLVYKRRGIRSGGATHSIYEVKQRPSYYLIDPNGILLKCLGEDLKRD